MSKWLEDLLLNIEIWLYRRLRRLLQHGGTDFAVSLDTLHAELAQKEQYRDGVYLHLRERLEGTEEKPLAEGVPVRPLPATQDLEHLQEAVELLGERKIEDASPDIPDGVSLVRLLCDSSLASQVTELVDTNTGYSSKENITGVLGLFANLVKATFNFITIAGSNMLDGNSTIEELHIPYLTSHGNTSVANPIFINSCSHLKKVYLDNLESIHSNYAGGFVSNCSQLEEIYAPKLSNVDYKNFGYSGQSYRWINNANSLRKFVLGKLTYCVAFGEQEGCMAGVNRLIHLEIGDGTEINLNLRYWSPTMSLRTDTTASDYIDLREDKDDSGEFINATNLEQFLANFRKYIILRVANRTGQTALTLTLSAAVYQSIYGLDSSNNQDNNSWARTHTLADLGLTADDLTEAEQAAGITVNTIYANWLNTYRSAINWNIGH